MTKPVRRHRIAGFFAVLNSATAASAAVERKAVPLAHDLTRLGIDAAQFRRIGR